LGGKGNCRPLRFYLLSDGAVLVVSAALKEAVTHHALAKQEQDHQQHE